METMEALVKSPVIRAKTEEGSLSVLALFADGERDAWRPALSLPPGWTDAIDDTGVQERELYFLRELPALYLLDRNNVVELKDATAEEVESRLAAP